MTKVIFNASKKPELTIWLFKKCLEEVLETKSIRGITLKHILQESLPEFSLNDIRLDQSGRVVLNDYLYNALEFGTLTLPRLQLISMTKRRMGRRPAWQIVL